MCLSHEVINMGGRYTIVWENISKDIKLLSENSLDRIKEAIWEGFKAGVEAERDRIYAITGEWPPKKQKEK